MDALPVLNCWVTCTVFLTGSQKVPGRAWEALACALGHRLGVRQRS
jgi:hypothetical protein